LFRLNGIRLDVPPLRERPDEIEPLARSFLERACRTWHLGQRELSPEAIEALQRCSWPGNVRQLRYAIERAALLGTGALIMREDLPEHVTGSNAVPRASATCPQFDAELGLKRQLARYERALLEEALRRAGGDRQTAAKLLRVPLRTLFRKLRSTASADSSSPA
jgi:DNA-binding NtrC family response regulator